MLENIKSKLHDYLLSQGSTQTPSKNNIPKKISTTKNTPHPNKTLGTGNARLDTKHSQPDISLSRDQQLPVFLAATKNPETEKAAPLVTARALTAPTVEAVSQPVEDDRENMQLIGRGSRGKVYKNGDTVIKIVNPKNSSIASCLSTQKQLRHEVDMCNKYWQQKNGSSPAKLNGNQITMPFVEGAPPEPAEVRDAVKALHKRGLMIADARCSNFIKTRDGEVVPVDFGLLFMEGDTKHLDKQVKIEIVHDFIKGGYRYIPAELKPHYLAHLKELDKALEKNSPTGTMDIVTLSRAGFRHSFT